MRYPASCRFAVRRAIGPIRLLSPLLALTPSPVFPMDSFAQQQMFVMGSLLCAGIGVIHDVRERTIPNRLTGPAVAAGLLLHTLAGGWRGLGDSALAGLVVGAIFVLFFVAGGMGAGDVKLMMAVGCFVGLSPLGLLVISTAVAGGLFALAVSLYHSRLRETLCGACALLLHHTRHGFKPHPDLNLSNQRTLRLPFALPVAAGCLFTFCALVWEAHP